MRQVSRPTANIFTRHKTIDVDKRKYNAFTEATKKVNPHTQIRRGEALQRLFDEKYEVALPS